MASTSRATSQTARQHIKNQCPMELGHELPATYRYIPSRVLTGLKQSCAETTLQTLRTVAQPCRLRML